MSLDIEQTIRDVNKIEQDSGSNKGWQSIKISSAKPVQQWDERQFVKYFASLYKKATNKDYIITWETDLTHIKALKALLSKFGYEVRKTLKDFMDWAYENRELIISKKSSFLLGDLRSFVNNFVSKSIKIEVNSNYDAAFITKIKLKLDNGLTMSEFLVIYGIPVAATYLSNMTSIPLETVEKTIGKVLDNLYAENKMSDLMKIAKQSINLSPYPDKYSLLDWRNKYLSLWKKLGYKEENWWRDEDYSGTCPEHYQSLLIP